MPKNIASILLLSTKKTELEEKAFHFTAVSIKKTKTVIFITFLGLRNIWPIANVARLHPLWTSFYISKGFQVLRFWMLPVSKPFYCFSLSLQPRFKKGKVSLTISSSFRKLLASISYVWKVFKLLVMPILKRIYFCYKTIGRKSFVN